MGFIHIYKVFDTSRKTKTYRSDSLLKRVKINEEGNVSLGNGTYRVDADKSGHETRTKFLLFKVPAFVHYYRQGNPEPMDPIGFGFDTDIPASLQCGYGLYNDSTHALVTRKSPDGSPNILPHQIEVTDGRYSSPGIRGRGCGTISGRDEVGCP